MSAFIVVGIIIAAAAGAFMMISFNIRDLIDRSSLQWRHRTKFEWYAGAIFMISLVLLAADGGFLWFAIGRY